MINNVFLIGRVGGDPQVHTTQSGKSVVKISVATWVNVPDETHESGWKTITSWHNVAQWSDYAQDIANRITKGTVVAVTGAINYREYEDKDGVKRYVTDIIGKISIVSQPAVKTHPAPQSAPPPSRPPMARDDMGDNDGYNPPF